jgi:hypothetical protein
MAVKPLKSNTGCIYSPYHHHNYYRYLHVLVLRRHEKYIKFIRTTQKYRHREEEFSIFESVCV